jgi:hypothetical protein
MGAPGGGGGGGWRVILGVAFENESRCIKVCLEARRLMSRSPFKSPRLKLLLPCLNSHKGDSGDAVWKTSLTV